MTLQVQGFGEFVEGFLQRDRQSVECFVHKLRLHGFRRLPTGL